MLIVICGMHRSGSTLVAQLVRGLLAGQDLPVTISDNGLGSTVAEMQARAACKERIWLVKVHQQAKRFEAGLPDEGAIYFYTYRDLRDALASAWRKNRLQIGNPLRTDNTLRAFLKSQIRAAKIFEAKANLWRGRYEEFIHDLEGLAIQLAKMLNIEASAEMIQHLVTEVQPDAQRERVRQLSEGNQAIRASSFITSNHITDGREGAWKETLTVAEAQLAERIARPWLKSRGYTLCFRKSQRPRMDSAEKMEARQLRRQKRKSKRSTVGR